MHVNGAISMKRISGQQNPEMSESQKFRAASTPGIFRRSIGLKFLVLVAVLVFVFSGILIFRTQSQSSHCTEKLLDQQVRLALYFDVAIRQYVAQHIRPFAEDHVDKGEFIPEVMSTSYVARNIFERVRSSFPDYILKFSSDNPRNPKNLATDEELEIINYFEKNPDARQWTGQITLKGKLYRAQFFPRRMTKSCLGCHGEPEDAPKSLLARYGDKNGFHRTLNSVIALDTVAIPVEKYRQTARSQTLANSAVLFVGLAILLGAIYWIFYVLVARRLARISNHFTDAVNNKSGIVSPVEECGADEVGILARAFNALAGRLSEVYETLERRVVERTEKLQITNTDLHKEIIKREKAQQKLEENEQRYRVLFDDSPVGVFLMTDIFIDCNKEACRIWQCEREDIIGQSPIDFSPEMQPDGRPSVEKAREHLEAAMSGQAQTFYWQHIQKNGTPIDTEVKLQLHDMGGEKVLLATMQDITVRKRANEAVEREAAKLGAMISGMNEGVVFADASNKIVEVNDFFCRFAKTSREEIIGKSMEDLHEGDILKHLIRQIDEFRENPDSKPLEMQRRLVSAEVMLRMQPIYHAGRYDGVLLNVIDVTELVEARRRAEQVQEDLKESMTELERFNAAMLGREERILRMKEEVNSLSKELGLSPVYHCMRDAKSPEKPSIEQDVQINVGGILERMRQLQPLLDGFCDCVGVSSAIIDLKGNVIVGSNWQKICTDLSQAKSPNQRKMYRVRHGHGESVVGGTGCRHVYM